MGKMILIGTHGRFGEELVSSAEMIMGKMEHVECCSLLSGMSFEEYAASVEQILSKFPGETLCLVDLFGGTPSNVMTALSRKYNTQVVTGLNLPMLIEVYMNHSDLSIEDLAELALSSLSESGKHINYIIRDKCRR